MRLPAIGGGPVREVTPSEALALALELHRTGSWSEAQSFYAAILEAVPGHFDALHLLGVLHHQQSRNDEAAVLIERALRITPRSADALCNLGAVYRALGRLEEAAAVLSQAIALEPGLAQAHNNLGSTLQELGRREEAESAYRRAVALAPTYADAHSNLANVLNERGEHGAALRACGEALAIDREHAGALASMGNAWRALGHGDRARDAFERSLASNPDQADVHHNLALLLDDEGDRVAALATLRRALVIDPRHGPALSSALVMQRALAEWDGLDTLRAQFFEALEQRVAGLSPFALLLEDSTPAQQLACAQAWARQRAAQAGRVTPFEFARGDPERIRIGYVSADFYRHPTAFLIAGLIEAHDRKRFQVHAYSSGPDDGSAIRKRLVDAFDAFRDMRGRRPLEIAEQIHADGIDILVDLKGYTLDAVTEVFALRPAPIQLNYLGYPGTMGADFIDYVVADEVVAPPGADEFYTEKIIRLPGSYQVNDRKRVIAAETPSRAACGLPERGFVFCCFNAPQKISPDMFTIWMEMLRETPGSVLWLLDVNPASALKDNLRREAVKRGIDAQRIVFAARRPLEEYLALYRNADLFLDTLPYNAHTTASDALWAGCPVLTCPGQTFASRVAASLLHAAGLPELIAGTQSEYKSLAARLAKTDPGTGQLAELRARLGEERLTCALFDTALFVRRIESAFEQMHAMRAKGQPPKALAIT